MNVADMGLMRPQVYDCYYEGVRARLHACCVHMCKDVGLWKAAGSGRMNACFKVCVRERVKGKDRQ